MYVLILSSHTEEQFLVPFPDNNSFSSYLIAVHTILKMKVNFEIQWTNEFSTSETGACFSTSHPEKNVGGYIRNSNIF